MELLDFYPAPRDLIDSEVRVLNYLRNDPYIVAQHPPFAQSASRTYSKTRHSDSGLDFAAYLDVWHPEMQAGIPAPSMQGKRKPNVRLIIAALVKVTPEWGYAHVSYCLSVCRLHPGRVAIYRKFHFDVTISATNGSRRRQEHPTCHLQYCGKMVPSMEEMGCRTAQLGQLHPELSEPRIFFWPMSLGLLIDLALHEFPDARSMAFRETSEWRSIVRRQEGLVLLRFHERCAAVIADVNGHGHTLADEFYVG
jgi:hypothetical protein